jgi:two-component system sensor histidine kinase YesM
VVIAMIKYKIFRNLLIMLAILLIPTTLLFAYANQVSRDVVKRTLENSSSKQLEFAVQQMEQSLRQLEKQTLVLANDATVQSYASSSEFSKYLNHLLIRMTIEERLELLSQADPLIHQLSIYWPTLQEAVSTMDSFRYDHDELVSKPTNKWFSRKTDGKLTFHLVFADTSNVLPGMGNIIAAVETVVSSAFLSSVLDGLDESGNGRSFFRFPEADIIANSPVDNDLLAQIAQQGVFEQNTMSHPLLNVFDIGGTEYLVQSMRVPSLDGTLVSYIKLGEFLHPLQEVNWLVNGSLLLLFITGITISYMLYRSFRMPFGYLVRKIENLGKGDYGSRATLKMNNEFDYLFDRFNDMASRTQSLIENVYEEKVRTREAEYKHLQSQINPHFLYNCLFYIVSMAKKSPTAVISMAKNLADFYRYITRKAGEDTTVEDEVQLITNYLEVQSLRNKRLSYTIDIPAAMLELPVPSLLLQPLVENAIIHGIEQRSEAGKIQIAGTVSGSLYTVVVDDDGAGLPEPAIKELNERIHGPYQADEEMGCGLRNIHQRLVNRYGGSSGLSFSSNEWGGFRVTLHIIHSSQEDNHEHTARR